MAMEFAGVEFCIGNSVLIKRKRSKRQRPPPFSAATIDADFASGSDYFSIDHFSPSFSSDSSEITEEDEEAANCLLMLKKGIYPSENFSSRRFSDMDAARKDEYVVYECKTCYRTFPSFQALGGHRTFHNKKMKFSPEENTERSLPLLPPLVNINEDEEEEESRIDTSFILAPLPLRMISGKGKAKHHRCSICSAEFFSGQALGGHMTRHRTKMNSSSSCPNIMNFDYIEDVFVENRSKRLPLDLNFPASEDDHRDWFNC